MGWLVDRIVFSNPEGEMTATERRIGHGKPPGIGADTGTTAHDRARRLEAAAQTLTARVRHGRIAPRAQARRLLGSRLERQSLGERGVKAPFSTARAGRKTDANGKPAFAAILEWRSRELGDRFSEIVIAAIRRIHPGALDEGGR
jgi:hypothetical protein